MYNATAPNPLVMSLSDYAGNVGPTTRNSPPENSQLGLKATGSPDLNIPFPTNFVWHPLLGQIQGVMYGGSLVTISSRSPTGHPRRTCAAKNITTRPPTKTAPTTRTPKGLGPETTTTRLRTGHLQPIQDQLGLLAQDYRAFGSAHSGVFQMAWCDGSVSSMAYDIDLQVHRQNCSRGDQRDGADSASST